jgi:hypothetical protein
VEWGTGARWTLIIGGAFAAGMLAVWVFTGVWARFGLVAAFLVLALALYLTNRWSKWQAGREREKLERS